MKDAANRTVLCWPGRLLAEEDLRRHWASQGEIILGPGTIVTPLAWDWLRARKVRVRREERISLDASVKAAWAYAEESPTALVAAAVRALRADGIDLTALEGAKGSMPEWVRELAGRVVSGNPVGLCVFSREPALVACLASKIHGVRAVNVSAASHVESLERSLGPNLYAITADGRTYFELRQLLRRVTRSVPQCPAELASFLREVDGHAHR